MQKIKQREKQAAKQLQLLKSANQQKALKELIDDESIEITIEYCKRILGEKIKDNLSDYSPTRISQYIMQPQLQQLKCQFSKLPNEECKVEHFLIIMLKVMKFSFEKVPYFMMGVKDMFYEIVQTKKDYITYDSLFKYIIGEIITLKQDDQNTEFQVRYEEEKKQDYLLHDTGINKILYIKNFKIFIVLDQNSQYLKIYDTEMKIKFRLTPSKDKHHNKLPIILDFAYSELSSRIGLLLSDSSLSIINLQAYLTKSNIEFNSTYGFQITLFSPFSSYSLIYLQMINRWATISQRNSLLIFDPEKHKQEIFYEQVCRGQIPIKQVLEIVKTNTICLISGHQIIFYNQNLSQKKWKKFQYPSDIANFQYCEERNRFYVCGNEKIITIFEIVKHTGEFNISIFEPECKYNIVRFETFPFMSTILIIDQKHEVKLYNENKGVCQYSQSFKHIVKNPKRKLNMYKINKLNFAIFETYLLVMTQSKMSIEKEIQYNFADYVYFDRKKQNFYLSVNQQIVAFSIFLGQIRKSYSKETSNLNQHQAFFLAPNTNLFVLDKKKNLFEVYLKDDRFQGENKTYKKKLGIDIVIKAFYYQPLRTVVVVSTNSIYQVSNQNNNNFNVISTCAFEQIPKVTSAQFHYPIISILTHSQIIYQIHHADYSIMRAIDYYFPKDPTRLQEGIIISFDHDFDLGFDILLNNLNEVYLISVVDNQKQFGFKIKDHLPQKFKSTMFTSMKYQKLQITKNNVELYVILFNQSGYFTEMNLKTFIPQFFIKLQPSPNTYRQTYKEAKIIKFSQIPIKKIILNYQKNQIKSLKPLIPIKAHESSIQLVSKVFIQIPLTITISKDGFTKLWNHQQCLFSLKLPNLNKSIWNMTQIEDSKTTKSVNKVLQILQKMVPKKNTLGLETVEKSKNLKGVEYTAINYEDPIKIEFQNKEIQELVIQSNKITWDIEQKLKRQKQSLLRTRAAINCHPWRKNRDLIKIMDKASPSLNKKKIPKDLLNLRKSLDMVPIKKRTDNNINTTLIILPQINSYVPEPKPQVEVQKQEIQNEQEELQMLEGYSHSKKTKYKKKLNEFDEIDKQFKKKWAKGTNKKWSIHERQHSFIQQNRSKSKNVKQVILAPINQQKIDPIQGIKEIFQTNNREAYANKTGRIIKIPSIQIKKDSLFF